jgi:cyanobactin maturation PatA/PatG family protease
VRAVLLQSADPCELEDTHACLRFLTGKLNVERAVRIVTTKLGDAAQAAAVRIVTTKLGDAAQAAAVPCGCQEAPGISAASLAAAAEPSAAEATTLPPEAAIQLPSTPAPEVVPSEAPPSGSQAWAPLVYVLGTLGYDFGTEARRDTYKQLMAPVAVNGTVVPANPYDARQMVDHLRANASEARSLIWTLNLELTPIYAIEAVGAYGSEVYDLLVRLLAGEVAAEDSPEFIERVSIPGRLAGRTAKLFSGQVVPVVEVDQRRGLYGWEVNALISAAIEAARARPTEQSEEDLRRVLREFLARIYYDLRNLGTTSADRALNFAATNAFQAAQTFASALAVGMTLDTINVEKSPFCRMDSDCWDVKLRFFDPENTRRARKVFRFTLDVSDLQPVTLGDVRTWSEAG